MKDFYYLTEEFLKKEFVPPEILTEKRADIFFEKVAYVIDAIYLKTVMHKKNRHEYINLHSVVLQSILGTHYAKNILDLLIKKNIIECDGKYHRGEKSFGYRFTRKYWESTFKKGITISPRMFVRIEKNRKQQNDLAIGNDPVKKKIKESVEIVSFSVEEARMFVRDYPYADELRRERRTVLIESYPHFTYSTDSAGRFYHWISNLPTDLRQFIRYKGERLYAIDVACCQPLLLASLYPENCEEKSRYIDLVASGNFYKYVVTLMDDHFDLEFPAEKKFVKEMVYADLFYCSNERFTGLKSRFTEQFPILMEEAAKKKKEHHRNLPLLLQKLEAHLVIEEAGDLLQAAMDEKDFIFITMHDAIVTINKYVPAVHSALKLVVEGYLGFPVVIKSAIF